MKFAWRVPHNTISVVIREVCQAIQDEYMDELITCPTNSEDWKAISNHFYQRWNFPNTLGAIDGKHVAIKAPIHSGTTYHNYKGYFSVLLFAMCDADYKFVWADVGGRGQASDAQVFNARELLNCILDGSINFPDAAPLSGDDEDTP